LRVCHSPANVDHAGRTDLVRASRRSDATALGQSSLDEGHGATRHRWPTDALSRRHGLCLPVADGLGELGATVFLYDVEHRRGGGTGFDVVQMQGDAAIPKEAEDFEQVVHGLARKVASIDQSDLIDGIQIGEQSPPLGVLAATSDPGAVQVGGYHAVAAVYYGLPNVDGKFRFCFCKTSVGGSALWPCESRTIACGCTYIMDGPDSSSETILLQPIGVFRFPAWSSEGSRDSRASSGLECVRFGRRAALDALERVFEQPPLLDRRPS
jgi:hypothetical protein